MSWRSAAHLNLSLSDGDNPSSSAMRSLKALTRSEWPRVRGSWRARAPRRMRTRESASKLVPPASEASAASVTARVSLLTDPARMATENRAGTLSGKTSDICRSIANGSRGRVSLETAKRTAVEMASVTTMRISSVQPPPDGRVRLRTAAIATETPRGISQAAARSTFDKTGRPFHPLSCSPLSSWIEGVGSKGPTRLTGSTESWTSTERSPTGNP